MEKEVNDLADTVWELFATTGQIGYYNLFTALTNKEID
jgi:hypothetical protein